MKKFIKENYIKIISLIILFICAILVGTLIGNMLKKQITDKKVFTHNFQTLIASNETPEYSNKNLAAPDLMGKEYLGNGVYSIHSYLTYNVYSGIYTLNKNDAFVGYINISDITNTLGDITIQGWVINGVNQNALDIMVREPDTPYIVIGGRNDYNNISKTLTTETLFSIYLDADDIFNDFQFKIQIEKGTTATDYTVPLQPYLWHEKNLSYNIGDIIDSERIITLSFQTTLYYKPMLFRFSNTPHDFQEFGSMANDMQLNKPSGFSLIYNIINQDFADHSIVPLAKLNNGVLNENDFLYIGKIQSVSLVNKGDYVEYGFFDHNGNELYSGDTRQAAISVGYFTAEATNSDYNEAYDDGLRAGLSQGYVNGYRIGYEEGKIFGYDNGYLAGFDAGLISGDAYGFKGFLFSIIGGVGSVLAIELLPGFPIGAFFILPLVFGIIWFILGKKGGGD